MATLGFSASGRLYYGRSPSGGFMTYRRVVVTLVVDEDNIDSVVHEMDVVLDQLLERLEDQCDIQSAEIAYQPS
jgi:hypothetical protein